MRTAFDVEKYQTGSLAQLVEQRTLNPFVAGSIPARPTNKIKPRGYAGLFPFLVLRYARDSLVSVMKINKVPLLSIKYQTFV